MKCSNPLCKWTRRKLHFPAQEVVVKIPDSGDYEFVVVNPSATPDKFYLRDGGIHDGSGISLILTNDTRETVRVTGNRNLERAEALFLRGFLFINHFELSNLALGYHHAILALSTKIK